MRTCQKGYRQVFRTIRKTVDFAGSEAMGIADVGDVGGDAEGFAGEGWISKIRGETLD
jgi:hypothetical protein